MARLSAYREPLASSGRHTFAGWLRRLRGRSGAYVIRSWRGRVLYVGESHSGRLYGTITRHLQSWRGYTAGTTYNPSRVEVAYLTCSPDCAIREQLRLIRLLEPADNKLLAGEEEDIDPADFQD